MPPDANKNKNAILLAYILSADELMSVSFYVKSIEKKKKNHHKISNAI